jgi:hypothetical protein
MVALDVVSGNDYARNIPSKLLLTLDFGLSKNLDVIKPLKLKSDVRKVVGAYASAIMQKNTNVVVPINHFEPTLEIFSNLSESAPTNLFLTSIKGFKTSLRLKRTNYVQNWTMSSNTKHQGKKMITLEMNLISIYQKNITNSPRSNH